MLKSFLCFDVSSTTIGISSFNFDTETKSIKDIVLEFYKPPHENNEFATLDKVYNEISAIIIEKSLLLKQKGELNVVIEEAPMFMTGGGSSAAVIRILAVFTRIVGLAVYKNANVEPKLYPVATIRASLRKLAKIEEKIKKEDVPGVIETILRKTGNNDWVFPYIKKEAKGKRKLKKEFEDETYDMADALAVGLTALFKNGDIV